MATLLFISCSLIKPAQTKIPQTNPISKEAFIQNPLGYEPTKLNLESHLPHSYKLQTYAVKNRLRPQAKDTIFRFKYRQSVLFLFKNNTLREWLTAGKIYDSRIVLVNGIQTGITRDDFFKCFTNLPTSAEDTIKIMAKQKTSNSFRFIFKSNRLLVIKFDNKTDDSEK